MPKPNYVTKDNVIMIIILSVLFSVLTVFILLQLYNVVPLTTEGYEYEEVCVEEDFYSDTLLDLTEEEKEHCLNISDCKVKIIFDYSSNESTIVATRDIFFCTKYEKRLVKEVRE